MKTVVMLLGAFGGGFLVAGGVIALIVGLGIVNRFVGISHTAAEIRWYETMILLGAVFGDLLTVYQIQVPFGRWGLLLYGASSGIYTGGWIMALAEVVHIFPIFARRIGFTKGSGLLIWSVAVGKVIGSLLYFYKGW